VDFTCTTRIKCVKKIFIQKRLCKWLVESGKALSLPFLSGRRKKTRASEETQIEGKAGRKKKNRSTTRTFTGDLSILSR